VSKAALLTKFAGLKQWTRGKKVAPHKPLLVLYALEIMRSSKERMIAYGQIDEDLKTLLLQFSDTPNPAPQYPFWRLQADGVWEVKADQELERRASNKDPRKSELLSKNARGGFTVELFEALLAEPNLVDEVRESILLKFPEDQRVAVKEAVEAVAEERHPSNSSAHDANLSLSGSMERTPSPKAKQRQQQENQQADAGKRTPPAPRGSKVQSTKIADALYHIGDDWDISVHSVELGRTNDKVDFFRIRSSVNTVAEIRGLLDDCGLIIVDEANVENDNILSLMEEDAVLLDERNITLGYGGRLRGQLNATYYERSSGPLRGNGGSSRPGANKIVDELYDQLCVDKLGDLEIQIYKRAGSKHAEFIIFRSEKMSPVEVEYVLLESGIPTVDRSKNKALYNLIGEEMALVRLEAFGFDGGRLGVFDKDGMLRPLSVPSVSELSNIHKHLLQDGYIDNEVRAVESALNINEPISEEANQSAGIEVVQGPLVSSDPKELDGLVAALLDSGPVQRPEGQLEPRRVAAEGPHGFERDASVKAWVLEQAKGVCELCLKEAPFCKPDGRPYLEIHHPHTLADGGPDVIENAVALCPSCHRELHYGVNQNKRLDDLYAQVDRLVF